MNFATRLRESLSTPVRPAVSGHWHTVSLCLDETACEFLNVGVAFVHSGGVEVRMLDSFKRLQCLYDKRVDLDSLQHLLLDIEHALDAYAGVPLPEQLSDSIRIGPGLFAQGCSAEAVVDEFFQDVVSLGRPTAQSKKQEFRYYSNKKLRNSLLDIMIDNWGLEAGGIIQDHPYELRLRNARSIMVEVPLLSDRAVGHIVSGWYKSPLVVEKNILQASQDLTLVSTHSGRKPSLSMLLPSRSSGLSIKELHNVQDAASRQLARLRDAGVDVMTGNSNEELAEATYSWWQAHGGAA